MLNLTSTICKNLFTTFVLVTALVLGRAYAADDEVIGKKITNFAAKVTSVTYLEDRSVLNLQTFGDVGPYGTVGVTAAFMQPLDGDGKTGSYSSQGISFRSDGSIERIRSNGVWTTLGEHRWQVKAIGISSKGGSVLAVGVLELETMSFKGSVYSLE